MASTVAAAIVAPKAFAAIKAAAPAPVLARKSFAGKALRVSPVAAAPASRSVTVQAADRPLWYPGGDSPSYLDGSLPGDYGFDPLGLGSDPELLKWFVQAELQNARWAMLAVAGIIIPEFFTKIGILNVPAWNVAGAAEYFAGAPTLFAVTLILFHFVEVRRWQDIRYPGSVNEDPIFKGNKVTGKDVGYPGGFPFNPLGFAADAKSEKELRQKEIKNGRLAMVAFAGFLAQSKVYPTVGPIQNLFDHLSDPGHINIFSSSAFPFGQ
jgi:light-harvesting complex I chlorophyll a/b binding protein 2